MGYLRCTRTYGLVIVIVCTVLSACGGASRSVTHPDGRRIVAVPTEPDATSTRINVDTWAFHLTTPDPTRRALTYHIWLRHRGRPPESIMIGGRSTAPEEVDFLVGMYPDLSRAGEPSGVVWLIDDQDGITRQRGSDLCRLGGGGCGVTIFNPAVPQPDGSFKLAEYTYPGPDGGVSSEQEPTTELILTMTAQASDMRMQPYPTPSSKEGEY